jgi:hypothetical protein
VLPLLRAIVLHPSKGKSRGPRLRGGTLVLHPRNSGSSHALDTRRSSIAVHLGLKSADFNDEVVSGEIASISNGGDRTVTDAENSANQLSEGV